MVYEDLVHNWLAGTLLSPAHRSVKSQVCQLVHVIQKSLVHIAAIFGQRPSLDGRQGEWVSVWAQCA